MGIHSTCLDLLVRAVAGLPSALRVGRDRTLTALHSVAAVGAVQAVPIHECTHRAGTSFCVKVTKSRKPYISPYSTIHGRRKYRSSIEKRTEEKNWPRMLTDKNVPRSLENVKHVTRAEELSKVPWDYQN